MLKLGAAALAASVAIACVTYAGEPAFAASGSTYYVNNLSGSGCSDSGPGTDPAAPWCDFSPINSSHFAAGDEILLARGAVWDQELDLADSGAPGAPIVIDAYGQGALPEIDRQEASLTRGILLTNVSDVTVQNLAVVSASVGVEAYYSTLNHSDLTLNAISVSDIAGIHEANQSSGFTDHPTCMAGQAGTSTLDGVYESSGIEITGPNQLQFGPSDHALMNLTVSNITGTHNEVSVAVDFCNGPGATDGSDGSNLITNASFTGLDLTNDDGNGRASGCPNSVHLSNLTNSSLTQSTISAGGGCDTNHGTTGLYMARVSDFDVSGNTIANTPITNSGDRTGVDFEGQNDSINLHDNLIEGNAGAGIEILGVHGSSVENTNLDIYSNDFIKNGTTGYGDRFFGSIARAGSDGDESGSIHDNTYHEYTVFTSSYASSPGSFANFTFANNNPSYGVTSLVRYVKGSDHWVTTSAAPLDGGYLLEGSVGFLYTTQNSGTVPLFSCVAGTDHFMSGSSDCEGQTVLGVDGYLYPTQPASPATHAIYRCNSGGDHFVTDQSGCEGATTEGVLGYAVTD